jgi:periplasmic protein TonB
MTGKPRRYQWVVALLLALIAHWAVAILLEPPAPIVLEGPGLRIALGGAGPAGGDAAARPGGPDAPLSAAATAEAIAPVAERVQAVEPTPPKPITALDADEPLEATTKESVIRSREPPPPQPQRAARVEPKPKTPTAKPRPPAPEIASDAAEKSPGTSPGHSAATRGGTPSETGRGGGGDASGSAQGGKSKDGYYAELAAWLERHKRYPLRARQLRQEGVARVRFVIDRNGRVISHRIEKSSGHATLDEAASELLRRASPMPAIPPSIEQARLEIVIPIAYQLR